MELKEWAKNEIELLGKRVGAENYPSIQSSYDAVLKAYYADIDSIDPDLTYTLMSWILKRLYNNLPLSPINENDLFIESTELTINDPNVKKVEVSTRMPSLYKYTLDDGSIKYSDKNRAICVSYVDNFIIKNDFLIEELDKLYPIKFPYYPKDSKYIFYTQRYSNVMGVSKIELPSGELINFNKYYKLTDTNNWEEITEDEFLTYAKELEVN